MTENTRIDPKAVAMGSEPQETGWLQLQPAGPTQRHGVARRIGAAIPVVAVVLGGVLAAGRATESQTATAASQPASAEAQAPKSEPQTGAGEAWIVTPSVAGGKLEATPAAQALGSELQKRFDGQLTTVEEASELGGRYGSRFGVALSSPEGPRLTVRLSVVGPGENPVADAIAKLRASEAIRLTSHEFELEDGYQGGVADMGMANQFQMVKLGPGNGLQVTLVASKDLKLSDESASELMRELLDHGPHAE